MSICKGCGYPLNNNSMFCNNCSMPFSQRKPKGTIVGRRYRIEQTISRMAGGWIYSALDKENSRIVRLKEYMCIGSILKLLENRLQKRKHVIVNLGIQDYFFENDNLYFVFQYANSISLKEKKYRNMGKPFSFDKVVSWLKSITGIINYFHSQKPPVYFGDLSPESFALTLDEQVILRDPEVSFLLSGNSLIKRYIKNGFVAPELKRTNKIDFSCDIYSLGAIALYLLTPIKEGEESIFLFKVKDALKLKLSVNDRLIKLITGMLRGYPESRPSSLGKISRELISIEKNESPWEYCLNRGIHFLNSGKKEQALREFSKTVQVKPEWALGHFWLGKIYYEDQEYEIALQKLNKALDVDPRYYDALYLRGLIYRKLFKYDEAILDFSRVVKMNPSDSNAYFWRGKTYKSMEEYSKALGDFNKAADLEPRNAKIFLWRGLTKFESGLFNEAIEDYNYTLALDPKSALAYLGRGMARQSKGDKGNALEDFNKSIELNPDYADGYLERGILYNQILKWELSIKDLNKAIELDPENTEVYFYRGKAYHKLHKNQESLKELNYFIKIAPDVFEAYYVRSCVKKEIGDFYGAKIDEDKYNKMQASKDIFTL